MQLNRTSVYRIVFAACLFAAVTTKPVRAADGSTRDIEGLWEGVTDDGLRVFMLQIDESGGAQGVMVVSPDVLFMVRFKCESVRWENASLDYGVIRMECKGGSGGPVFDLTVTGEGRATRGRAEPVPPATMPPALPAGGAITARFSISINGGKKTVWIVPLVSRGGSYFESLMKMKVAAKLILDGDLDVVRGM